MRRYILRSGANRRVEVEKKTCNRSEDDWRLTSGWTFEWRRPATNFVRVKPWPNVRRRRRASVISPPSSSSMVQCCKQLFAPTDQYTTWFFCRFLAGLLLEPIWSNLFLYKIKIDFETDNFILSNIFFFFNSLFVSGFRIILKCVWD